MGKRDLFCAKSSIRSVADMMTIRSGRIVEDPLVLISAADLSCDSLHLLSRSLATLDKTPIKTSVLTPLSCASSTMMTLYRDRRKSDANSRNSTPSVMNLMHVSGDVLEEYRI